MPEKRKLRNTANEKSKLANTNDTRPNVNEKLTELLANMEELHKISRIFEEFNDLLVSNTLHMDLVSMGKYFIEWYKMSVALMDEHFYLETGKCTRKYHEQSKENLRKIDNVNYSIWGYDMIMNQADTT
jgi:hypothetical protein